jgi:hypothetical protein
VILFLTFMGYFPSHLGPRNKFNRLLRTHVVTEQRLENWSTSNGVLEKRMKQARLVYGKRGSSAAEKSFVDSVQRDAAAKQANSVFSFSGIASIGKTWTVTTIFRSITHSLSAKHSQQFIAYSLQQQVMMLGLKTTILKSWSPTLLRPQLRTQRRISPQLHA